jgi:hypothetical protein
MGFCLTVNKCCNTSILCGYNLYNYRVTVVVRCVTGCYHYLVLFCCSARNQPYLVPNFLLVFPAPFHDKVKILYFRYVYNMLQHGHDYISTVVLPADQYKQLNCLYIIGVKWKFIIVNTPTWNGILSSLYYAGRKAGSQRTCLGV